MKLVESWQAMEDETTGQFNLGEILLGTKCCNISKGNFPREEGARKSTTIKCPALEDQKEKNLENQTCENLLKRQSVLI